MDSQEANITRELAQATARLARLEQAIRDVIAEHHAHPHAPEAVRRAIKRAEALL